MPSLTRRLSLALLITAVLLGNSVLAAPGPMAAGSEAATAPPALVIAPEDGIAVARVYFEDRAELDWLAETFDAVEYVDRAAGYIVLLLRPAELDRLRQAGWRVDVDPDKTALLNPPTAVDAQAGGIPGYDCYRTIEETYDSLNNLAASHADLARWVSVGESWIKTSQGGQAGYELRVLILTNRAVPGPKPVLLVMGALHAREYVTAELAARFAEQLVSGYGVDADITWLLDQFEVHILPQANPDGRKLAEAGYYQRKNMNPTGGEQCLNAPSMYFQSGVDLNRNGSFQWGGGGSSGAACDQTYRGSQPASEPETQAIQAYLASIFPDQRGPDPGDAAGPQASGVYVSLHSYGGWVLFPWAWTSSAAAPDAAALASLGRKLGYFNGYQACQAGECLYHAAGAIDDWAYGELGVAAYTIELGSFFFQDCQAFESTILPANQPALLYALKAARRPYQAPAGPDSLHVALGAPSVAAGRPVSLTASADDTRYAGPNAWGSEPTQTIAAARYSLGAPSWAPGSVTYPLLAVDGAFDEPAEALQGLIDTSALAPGRWLVFVESQDTHGNWGPPTAAFLRVEAPIYSLSLSPDPSLAFGSAGQVVTHTLLVTNTGSLTTSFAVSAGGLWAADAPDTVGPLAPGASATLEVAVTIPLWAAPGSHDLATLSLSHGAGQPPLATAVLLTSVHGDYGLALLPPTAELDGPPGGALVYPLQLVHLGSQPDTYTVTVDSTGWLVQVAAPGGQAAVGATAQGEIVPLTVRVNIPLGAADGAPNIAYVWLVSSADPERSASVKLFSSAAWLRYYFLVVSRD